MSTRKPLSGGLRTLFYAVGVVTILTLLSRLLGFIRWLAQATWVGAGEVGNAYASANQIPNLLFEIVIGGALSSLVIPLLSRTLRADSSANFDDVASAIFTWTLTLLLPLAVLVFLFSAQIASVLPVSKGSDPASQNAMAALFLQIFSVQLPFYGVSAVASGVLQAKERFAPTALAPSLSSLAVILTYFAYGHTSPSGPNSLLVLAWGTTFGVVMLSMPLLIPLHRAGVRLRPNWSFPPGELRRALRLGGYGIASLLVVQVYMVFVLFLTRYSGEVGTINVFQYAQAIFLLPFALLTFPLATVVFPRLSGFFAQEKYREAGLLSVSSTKVVVALGLYGTAGLLAVSPGMAALFAWNKPIPGLEIAINAMSPALLGYGLLYHLSRVFIAQDQVRHTFWAALLGWGVSIPAVLLLIKVWAPAGGNNTGTLMALGVGNAIGLTLSGIYLVGVWAQSGGLREVIRTLLVCLTGAVLGVLVARWAYFALLALHLPAGILLATIAGALLVTLCSAPGIIMVLCSLSKEINREGTQ